MLIINDRDKIDWKKGMTVRDVLNEMNYSYALITVTVNDQHVPKEDYESYKVPDEANVTIFHLAHGG